MKTSHPSRLAEDGEHLRMTAERFVIAGHDDVPVAR
jgi:hypothetical protein